MIPYAVVEKTLRVIIIITEIMMQCKPIKESKLFYTNQERMRFGISQSGTYWVC